MRVGETLDAAINLYRAHWKLFMAIVAFVTVPFVFLQTLLTELLTEVDALGRIETSPTDPWASGALGLSLGFLAIDYLLVRPFLTAAMVRAVAAAYLGETPRVTPVYEFALRRVWSVLWVAALGLFALAAVIAVTVVFGVVFATMGAPALTAVVAIPAVVLLIVVYVRWMFGAAVVVVEDRRGSRALGRSWRLSARAFWKIAGTTLLASLLVGIVGGILTVVPSLVAASMGSAGWVLRAAGAAASSVVTTPFVTMVTVLLYFDQRIRKEGLDLAIMSAEIGARSAP
jgi:hypothetical protein